MMVNKDSVKNQQNKEMKVLLNEILKNYELIQSFITYIR